MYKEIQIENKQPSTKCVKGAIHWFSINKPDAKVNSLKVRPFIIINRTNYKSSRVLLSPIQDLENYMENGQLKYPYHVALLKEKYKFLHKDSAILLDQIYTVSKDELFEECYIGSIDDFTELDHAIMYNFDLFESMFEEIDNMLHKYQDLYQEKFSRK
ncbi:type II toxin-antitoxin system PemK/MazF family toxin [Clostridium botulinum D/C]|uniref:type II toxin-antitoxin system PemK/MazF family toxin n=1 Tax=Clostridium botulinum TaxID=1491 RepID=UPI001E5DFC4E|nr:type II toxin-antitoxin system PemK/MazF family toxin [Clostridium botulinum]MCD3322055.1 type II toxin-antitoxin system PemK/MazF family toxin [Clostridium botulinum D/C]MCD3325272.1 type II toxin-antitoxin system PemK/MazF family toxin [Clostridium botulinum D/C]MCD3328388.1 type II toxin-antitoxin system PemK/MazF family toxin [Clostridium botulinum D/C]